MKLKGSDIVVECLLEQGVETVFGYPGGTILEVYDSLYKYQDRINHVLTSHEQGAAHAADGYARATGKVGVCMATLLLELPQRIWILFHLLQLQLMFLQQH